MRVGRLLLAHGTTLPTRRQAKRQQQQRMRPKTVVGKPVPRCHVQTAAAAASTPAPAPYLCQVVICCVAAAWTRWAMPGLCTVGNNQRHGKTHGRKSPHPQHHAVQLPRHTHTPSASRASNPITHVENCATIAVATTGAARHERLTGWRRLPGARLPAGKMQTHHQAAIRPRPPPRQQHRNSQTPQLHSLIHTFKCMITAVVCVFTNTVPA